MAELREDELEIVMEDGEVLHKRILFTANYGKKDVVFFTDYDAEDEEVNVMYYDEEGALTPLEEDAYGWAEEVLNTWIKDTEENEG
ncbi:MAG: hypothetical protein IIZ48_06855 [Erysipelotrichales bacterium]|nr:hypothetical protein [Erysipelotrichales bacterium]